MEDTTLKEPVEETTSDNNADMLTTPDATQEPTPQAPVAPKPSALKRICAIISLLLAIVAWGVFFFDPEVTAIAAAISAVTAIIGITVGRGCLRDIAITALIAAAILLIVLAAFYWGVPAAIASI